MFRGEKSDSAFADQLDPGPERRDAFEYSTERFLIFLVTVNIRVIEGSDADVQGSIDQRIDIRARAIPAPDTRDNT